MAVVKLPNKEELDKLCTIITIRTGHKITQQEILAECVTFSTQHLEELLSHFQSKKSLSKKRVQEIEASAEEFEITTKGSIDKDIYGD